MDKNLYALIKSKLAASAAQGAPDGYKFQAGTDPKSGKPKTTIQPSGTPTAELQEFLDARFESEPIKMERNVEPYAAAAVRDFLADKSATPDQADDYRVFATEYLRRKVHEWEEATQPHGRQDVGFDSAVAEEDDRLITDDPEYQLARDMDLFYTNRLSDDPPRRKVTPKAEK